MNFHRIGLAMLLMAASCLADSTEPYSWGKPNPQAVSLAMVEMLSVGERFNGWPVMVVGVLHFRGERSMLFLSREAYENFDTASAIGIDLRQALESGLSSEAMRKAGGKYVRVEGEYRAYARRQLEAMEVEIGVHVAGVVQSVTRVSLVNSHR